MAMLAISKHGDILHPENIRRGDEDRTFRSPLPFYEFKSGASDIAIGRKLLWVVFIGLVTLIAHLANDADATILPLIVKCSGILTVFGLLDLIWSFVKYFRGRDLSNDPQSFTPADSPVILELLREISGRDSGKISVADRLCLQAYVQQNPYDAALHGYLSRAQGRECPMDALRIAVRILAHTKAPWGELAPQV